MTLFLQVVISLLVVTGVIGLMWRMPNPQGALLGWAPPLALVSPWVGLVSAMGAGLLWWLPNPDAGLPVVLLLLTPGALACGVLVLWLYRGKCDLPETVRLQRMQAKVGIVLGLVGVALAYAFVLTHKKPFTPIGP